MFAGLVLEGFPLYRDRCSSHRVRRRSSSHILTLSDNVTAICELLRTAPYASRVPLQRNHSAFTKECPNPQKGIRRLAK